MCDDDRFQTNECSIHSAVDNSTDMNPVNKRKRKGQFLLTHERRKEMIIKDNNRQYNKCSSLSLLLAYDEVPKQTVWLDVVATSKR